MEEKRSDVALEPVDAQQGDGGQQEEAFETIDYVREIFLNSEAQKKSDRKRLNLSRACVVLLSILTVAIVAACAVVVPMAIRVGNEVNKTLAIVQSVDVEALTEDVDGFIKQANDTFVSVGSAVSVLDELDMASLNSAITQLEVAVQSLSEIDVATLNTAISNLNDAVAPLANFLAKFK
jgi:predicted PurR-regulated permease PerM